MKRRKGRKRKKGMRRRMKRRRIRRIKRGAKCSNKTLSTNKNRGLFT
jgi:hypothetical protein